jgi:hypothetical protein
MDTACLTGRYHFPRTAFFQAPGGSSGISEVSALSSGIAASARISRFWRAVNGCSDFNTYPTILAFARFFIFDSLLPSDPTRRDDMNNFFSFVKHSVRHYDQQNVAHPGIGSPTLLAIDNSILLADMQGVEKGANRVSKLMPCFLRLLRFFASSQPHLHLYIHYRIYLFAVNTHASPRRHPEGMRRQNTQPIANVWFKSALTASTNPRTAPT